MNYIHIYDYIGDENYSLSTLENQLNNFKEVTDVTVKIHSNGGSVNEGIAIYQALRRYAKEHNVKVITHAVGNLASIATVIYLAGDKRIGNAHIQPFVHNANLFLFDSVDANQLKEIANELESTNKLIASFYEKHTNLTEDQALEYMQNNTFIEVDKLIELGFSTEIEEIHKPENKLKIQNNMSSIFSMFKKSQTTNLILKDITGVEIDFYELEDGSPIVGDKARINGSEANGNYKVEEADKVIEYTFDKGTLTEIKEPELGVEEKDYDELKNELETLKNELATFQESFTNLKQENRTIKNKLEEQQEFIDFVGKLEPKNFLDKDLKNKATQTIINLKPKTIK